jgi:hypothetical protein
VKVVNKHKLEAGKDYVIGIDLAKGNDTAVVAPLGMSLRTKAQEMEYALAKERGQLLALEDEPNLHEFEFWVIKQNRFPYDIAYKTCHLLCPKRKFGDPFDQNLDEFAEFMEILKDYVPTHYDQIVLNMPRRRTVPDLLHYHLLVFHDSRKDMEL